MSGGGCGDAAARLRVELAGGVSLELLVARGFCFETGDRLIRLGVPEAVLLRDVLASTFGEALAGLLLARPAEEEDAVGILGRARRLYATRVARLEAARLRRRLGLLSGHALVADIWPLVSRMARLQRVHVWLRRPYLSTLSREGVGWLRGVARGIYAEHLFERLDPLLERLVALSEKLPGPPSLGSVVREAAQLQGFSPAGLLPVEVFMESLAVKPHPLTRDPLLLVRLDAARLATRLMRFEEQLYRIIGVERALRRRRSPIRSVELVEASGITPAVVKNYRDFTAAKWVLVAAAAPYYPRPRTSPSRRLQAEYHYNRVLASRGFHVPDPILVDPRRLRAAYTYIEGRTLADLVAENPLHPVYREYGALLARLHRGGVALWDSNPTNVIESGGRLYLVDLEQAREAASVAERAVDVAVAVYYTIPYSVAEVAKRAYMLARAYIEAGGSPEAVMEASKYKYAAPFMTLALPHLVEKARRALARAALEASGGGETG